MMISLKEVMLAINRKINESLQMNVDSKNLEEEFERPSVRTSIDNLKTSAFMQSMKERNFIVRIYYFSKNREKNKIELLEIQEKLEDAFFSHLKIKGAFFIYIDEIIFNVTDGILIGEFEVRTLEEILNDINTENMEELEIKTKVILDNSVKIEKKEELAEGFQMKYKFN
nr:MAG TPA: tail completion protein [Caudoviricetes sp.]